jgi:hypothetical protein
MKAEAVQFFLVGLRRVLEGKIFLSPRLNEQLIRKAIRSLESGSGRRLTNSQIENSKYWSYSEGDITPKPSRGCAPLDVRTVVPQV